MIKVIENEKLLDTKAQIIVQLVNDEGDLKNNIPAELNDEYHHITKEYIRFINHCRKHNEDVLGKIVWTPCDVWAIGLVDTIKNNHIEVYDKDFKYVALAFAKVREGKKYKIDKTALTDCLRTIINKAQAVKADVAIVYSDLVNHLLEEIASKSSINIYLYKEI